MKEIITISINREVKNRAKEIARKYNTTVSVLIETYLKKITDHDLDWVPEKGSVVREILGSVPDKDSRDYKTIIAEEKNLKYEKDTHR